MCKPPQGAAPAGSFSSEIIVNYFLRTAQHSAIPHKSEDRFLMMCGDESKSQTQPES